MVITEDICIMIKKDTKIDLVTCIVLTYKKFDLIYKTLDSILNQTYQKIEIIVSDDGSEFFPNELINDYIYRNKHNNLVNSIVNHSMNNMGTVVNYNNAIRCSSGKYIIPLAGDDCFFDNSVVERVIGRMIDNNWNHIICRRALCDNHFIVKRFIPTENEISKIELINTPEKTMKAIACGKFYNMASGSVFSFTKDFIKSNGLFDTKYRLWEDGPFYYKMSKSGIRLNLAYDIVQIFYTQGGVSSGKIHPQLAKDSQIFLKNVLQEDRDIYTSKEIRLIKFRYNRFGYSEMNILSKLFFCIRYFDIIIKRRIDYIKVRGIKD